MDKSFRGEEQDSSHYKASKGLIFLVNKHMPALVILLDFLVSFSHVLTKKIQLRYIKYWVIRWYQKKNVLYLFFPPKLELFFRKVLYASGKECLSDIIWYLTMIRWPGNIHRSGYVYSVPDALLPEEEKEISESSPHPVCLTRLQLCSKSLILIISRLTEKSLCYLHYSPNYNPSDLFSPNFSTCIIKFTILPLSWSNFLLLSCL